MIYTAASRIREKTIKTSNLFKLIFVCLLIISVNVQSRTSDWGQTPDEILNKTGEYLKNNPGDVDALFQQGVAHARLNQWPRATAIFQDLSAKHADWPEPKNNLAVALLKQGRIEQAQKVIDEAINSQPSFRVAQQNRNRIYEYLAVQAYDKVLGNKNNSLLPEMTLLTELSMKKTEPAPQIIVKEVPVQKSVPQNEIVNNIRQRLLAWSRAWSEGDIDHYFSSYSTRFRPSDPGTDYNKWQYIRRIRLDKAQNTQIGLDNIDIYLGDNKQRALAEFVQHYKSAAYQDRVIKQLILVLEKGNWLIISEREIEKLD